MVVSWREKQEGLGKDLKFIYQHVSVCMCICVYICCVCLCPVTQPCLTFRDTWTVALQAPLSMWFPRQEYWCGLPLPPPGDLPNPGIKPMSVESPALAGGFSTPSTTWEAHTFVQFTLIVNPRRQNVRDSILGVRKFRLISATLLKYIFYKDENICTVAEVGKTLSEDVQCLEAIWEGLTEEVTLYLPFKFKVGRTFYKGISVRKKKSANSCNMKKSGIFGER